MQRDLERVEEIYAAQAKNDVPALLMLMGQEVEVVQSPELPWGGNYVGHQGVRQYLEAQARHLEAEVLIERLIDAGDRVVAVGRIAGTARATKLEFDLPVVHVWTFSEGQVERLEAYLDNATMLSALGA